MGSGAQKEILNLFNDIKTRFMHLGLKKKTVTFVMCTFIGTVLLASIVFGVVYTNSWRSTVVNHVKAWRRKKKRISGIILIIWTALPIISATATGCRIFL